MCACGTDFKHGVRQSKGGHGDICDLFSVFSVTPFFSVLKKTGAEGTVENNMNMQLTTPAHPPNFTAKALYGKKPP